jgi:hypothetical protein
VHAELEQLKAISQALAVAGASTMATGKMCQ